ncbi:MAG: hypothetical protein AB1609_19350 [Bacillota bacterium]
MRYPLAFPKVFTLDNFRAGFAGKDFLLWFWNSTVLTAGSMVLTAVLAALAAYASAHMRFRGRDFLFNLIVPLMAISRWSSMRGAVERAHDLVFLQSLGTVYPHGGHHALPQPLHAERFLLSWRGWWLSRYPCWSCARPGSATSSVA